MNSSHLIRDLNDKGLFTVPFTAVEITDAFWRPRQEEHRTTTIRLTLDKAEETGRIDNFRKAAGWIPGEHVGRYYNDSDVYKILEGVAYTLQHVRDEELERRADKVIDAIAAAQERDGYINTFFTLKEPEKKWTDMTLHETYCGGHLIEAGIAYARATGKEKLLHAGQAFADHLLRRFGPGGEHWVSGHQEIELALTALYGYTGHARYVDLAYWFLEQRGRGHGRGTSWEREDFGAAYAQDDVPVAELAQPLGHAVRAMYMYAAMAELVALGVAPEYESALARLWESIVEKNMYITGGIGPSAHNEGFTRDYDLPNATSYAETCASVGMVLWNYRMFLISGDGRYMDVMERALYNGALSGVSLSGARFFYANPLESDGTKHRQEWYDCSCCPTTIARFIPSIGKYVYATGKGRLFVNLYMQSAATVRIPHTGGESRWTLVQNTMYPWDGQVALTLDGEFSEEMTVSLRLPTWAHSWTASINAESVAPSTGSSYLSGGYLHLRRVWTPGDRIELNLDMPVRVVSAHPAVEDDRGRVAVCRGPLVYCAESVDNGSLSDVVVSDRTRFLRRYRPMLLGGVVELTGYNPGGAREVVRLIPYYSWDNREPGEMRVWFDNSTYEPLYVSGAMSE